MQSVVLPAGDPEAGREVFLSFGCDYCHRVSSDPELGSIESQEPGPDLGSLGQRKGTGEIASSIIAPSHELSVNAGLEQRQESPMPNFNDAITLGEWLDLVAYIETAGRRRP